MIAIKTIIDNRKKDGWVTGILNGEKLFQAKIYDEPSDYGINSGRISKLMIWSSKNSADKKVIFNYDRGHDVCEIEKQQLDEIVSQIENKYSN